MSEFELSQTEAANLFIKWVAHNAYLSASAIETETLETYVETPEAHRINAWYQGLTEEEKQTVRVLINSAVETAIYRFCMRLESLDSLRQPELSNNIGEFAVFLRAYSSVEDFDDKESPILNVRVNNIDGHSLQDMFKMKLEEEAGL